MKKLLYLFAIVGTAFLSSCEGPEGPQGPAGNSLEASVFELKNVNFNFDGSYFLSGTYPTNLTVLDSDVVLMYRLSDLINSTTPIWQQIPTTMEFDNGYVNYDFDFSRQDFQVYLYGDVPNLQADYATNQTIRVVVIPGSFVDRKANKVDLSDYNAVIKAYNIKETDFKTAK